MRIFNKWWTFFGSQPNSCEGRRKINSPCYENGFLVISKSPSTIAEILEMWLSTWEPGLTKWRCDNGRYQQHHPIVFFQRGAPNIWQSNNGEHEVLNPWIFWVSWYQHQIYIYISQANGFWGGSSDQQWSMASYGKYWKITGHRTNNMVYPLVN